MGTLQRQDWLVCHFSNLPITPRLTPCYLSYCAVWGLLPFTTSFLPIPHLRNTLTVYASHLPSLLRVPYDELPPVSTFHPHQVPPILSKTPTNSKCLLMPTETFVCPESLVLTIRARSSAADSLGPFTMQLAALIEHTKQVEKYQLTCLFASSGKREAVVWNKKMGGCLFLTRDLS